MTHLAIEELDALTRRDLNIFVERCFYELNGSTTYLDNFHIALICAELQAVARGQQRRLAIALPPRSLKSMIVSVAFVAWLLGNDPSLEIICASYGQQLADSLARDCRQVMQSSWYRRVFPEARLSKGKTAVNEFKTTAGGVRRATSVGGALTGFGADFIMVDDPVKPEDASSEVERVKANKWIRQNIYSRLNAKARGAVIIIMQRLHEDDMIGHVASFSDLKIIAFPAIAQGPEVYRFRTPFGWRIHYRAEGEALHPERENLAVLEMVRREMGNQFFTAQYLQMPSPPGGSIVKAAWFSRFDLSCPPAFDEIFQSWDTASRGDELADYSVCTTWGKKGKQLFLLHVFRKRLEYPDLKRAVIEQAGIFGAKTVFIEDAASGVALIQDLKRDHFYKVKAVKPKGDKIMRLRAITGMIEAGQVFLPMAAHWLDDYQHELVMFPASKYNDQVDSTSQALSSIMLAGTDYSQWVEMLEQRAADAKRMYSRRDDDY